MLVNTIYNIAYQGIYGKAELSELILVNFPVSIYHPGESRILISGQASAFFPNRVGIKKPEPFSSGIQNFLCV